MVAIACLVAIIAFAAMGLGNRPHTASSSDAADDAGGAGGRISSPAQAHDVSEQDADAESGSSAEAASSTESAAATAATSSSSNSSTASETPTTAELVSGTQTASPPKNGYDPATNFTVTLAGVDFQIPRYFRAKTLATDGGGMHYYAETGSSVAEIMTSENRVESPESAANPDEWKDSFVTGIMKSGDLFESIVSSIDFELEGFAARLVTFSGTMKGVSVKTKLLVFHDPNSQIVASLIFGQSANAQFDYSGDFAKVVASAKRAESTS